MSARTFLLVRDEDASGVSGTGVVAEGVAFSNGKLVLAWVTGEATLGIYDSMEQLLKIHGHNGATRIEWNDGDVPAPQAAAGRVAEPPPAPAPKPEPDPFEWEVVG